MRRRSARTPRGPTSLELFGASSNTPSVEILAKECASAGAISSAMAQRSIDDRLDFIFRPIPDHERGGDAQSYRARADARRNRDLPSIAIP